MMRFIVVTCCALVVVHSASIRDRFIVTPQNFSNPSENFIFSSQKVKIISVPGQALRRPLTQNVGKLKAEEVIYNGLNSIRNRIENGNEKLSNDFWSGLNNSVQELVIKHKNSNELGSEFQNFMQEKMKNQQGFGQSVINFFTEGVSNIVNSLGGAPPPTPVSNVPQAPQPLDDIEFDTTTQKPNFLSNVVNSVQQVFQATQRPPQVQAPQQQQQQQQAQVPYRPQPVQAPQRPQQAQPQAPFQPQPVQPAPTFNQPILQDSPSTQRPNFLSNVVNSVQQAFKPPPQPAQPQQQIQLQVPIQPVQPIQDTPTTTHRPNFLSNVANSVQQAFKPPQQAVPIQQAQLQAPIQPVQPINNQPFQDTTATSTQRPNFISNVVNSVQQAFKPPASSQQEQPLQTQPEQSEPQQVQIQISIQATQVPSPTQSPGTERPGLLSNVVGQVQQAFQRPQQGAINQAVDTIRPIPSTPPLDFVEMPTTTTTTTQSSLLQNIGQAIQGFRPQNRPAPSAPPPIQETTPAAATTTLAPNIFQNIGQAIQGFRPQPTQTTTTSTPAPPQPYQVQQVVASSSQVPLSQNNNLQIAIAEVAACIVKTRIDSLVEQSKHKISGEL